jgi:hypothetical protein
MGQPQFRALRKLRTIKYTFYYTTSVIISFGNDSLPVYNTGVRVSHTSVAMFLCETPAKAEERAFISETKWVLCEIEPETQEICEHWEYKGPQHNHLTADEIKAWFSLRRNNQW